MLDDNPKGIIYGSMLICEVCGMAMMYRFEAATYLLEHPPSGKCPRTGWVFAAPEVSLQVLKKPQ